MERCPICLEDLNPEKGISQSDCKHSFCEGCLNIWLKLSLMCPVCRKEIKWFNGPSGKVKTSPPEKEVSKETIEDHARAALDLQIEELFSQVALGALSEIIAQSFMTFLDLGSDSSGPPERHTRKPIEHFPQALPIGCYDHLTREFQGLWRKPEIIKGTREAFSLGREDIIKYPTLKMLVDELTKHPDLLLTTEPKSAFINWYKTGDSYAPWHQDSYGATVVMISVGDTRKLATRRKGSKNKDQVEIYKCEDGDVVIFTERWNKDHQHSILKTSRKTYGRISIVLFFDE